MCLIIAKPKGTPISEPLWTSIRNASHINSHGMGYMFKLNGENEVFINKGFFRAEEIIEEIDGMGLKAEDELVVHLRMATHGDINVSNCHPFVVSSSENEVLTNKEYVQKPCITHNGVVREFIREKSPYSDTFHFVKDFLSRIDNEDLMKSPKILQRYNKKLRTVLRSFNKFAILSPTRDLALYGNFQEEEGYWYSNSGYSNTRYISNSRVRVGNRYCSNHYENYYD